MYDDERVRQENPCDATRIGKIPNVRTMPGPNSPMTDIYFVLLGAAQYINDYHNIKGRPNAKLYFDPSKGFNAGALTLAEYTRNSSGIGSGQEILLSYGTDYDLTTQPNLSVTYAARVKGPLAKW